MLKGLFGQPIRNGKSGGTSWDAYAYENELGMYDCKFQHETLEWLVEQFSKHFGVDTPKVIRNNRTGRTSRRGRTLFGQYKYNWSGSVAEIHLSGGGNAVGFTVGTLLHEFCHHLAKSRGGRAHDAIFKRTHEEVLLAYDSDIIVTPERLQQEEQLATLYLVNEDMYEAIKKQTDTDEEMVERATELLGKHWVNNYEVS